MSGLAEHSQRAESKREQSAGEIWLTHQQEIVRMAANTLEQLKLSVQISNVNGEFFIPDIRMTDVGVPKLHLMNWLLTQLTKEFPQYEWKQTENWVQPGILISWRLKGR